MLYKNDQCITSAFSAFLGILKEIRQIEARKKKALLLLEK